MLHISHEQENHYTKKSIKKKNPKREICYINIKNNQKRKTLNKINKTRYINPKKDQKIHNLNFKLMPRMKPARAIKQNYL